MAHTQVRGEISSYFVVMAVKLMIGHRTFDQVDFCIKLMETWPLLDRVAREDIQRWIRWWLRDNGYAALEIDVSDAWCQILTLPT